MSALYEHLPVYKKALDVTVYFETVVRNFSRYHKYTVGSELRNLSKKILLLVALANTRQKRKEALKEALERLDEDDEAGVRDVLVMLR